MILSPRHSLCHRITLHLKYTRFRLYFSTIKRSNLTEADAGFRSRPDQHQLQEDHT